MEEEGLMKKIEDIEEVKVNMEKENEMIKMFMFVVRVIMGMICGYLAWECNQMDGIIFRLLVTGVAVMFPEVYGIYYAVYHVFMGVKCYGPVVESVTQANSGSVNFL